MKSPCGESTKYTNCTKAEQQLRWLVFAFACCCVSVGSGGEIEFQPVLDYIKLPADLKLGRCSAVAVNSRGEIHLFHRGPRPILSFDREGKFLRSWGDDVVHTAHGLRIDREDNVWATDIGNHRVFKFDPQGKLLLMLGTGKPGDSENQFNKPTDVAFGPRGEFYVSDGYGNTRVMKFSPQGGFITSWGRSGKGPGEFNLPHAIVRDTAGRLLVGDRENNRIQVFDEDGKFLEAWPGFAPFGLALDQAGNVFVADGRAHKVLQLDTAGRVVQSWGQRGKGPGEFELPHMLACDAAGNLLIAEVNGQRLQMLRRKSN